MKQRKFPIDRDRRDYPNGYIPIWSPLWKMITFAPTLAWLWLMATLFPDD
ncbi:hypothetical protein [Verrucomicrobium spinosum]|nr:hypothetical protein [Verrucomicrobium spinosum]